MPGYTSQAYAESYAELGTILHLQAARGWILRRVIPGTGDFDAMGLYPLFCCEDLSGLRADMEALRSQIITLTAVSNPEGAEGVEHLRLAFDEVTQFKDHYMVNLDSPVEQFVTKHHLYYARRCVKALAIEPCSNPNEYLQDWIGLYQHLIETHDLKGMHRFSAGIFRKQFAAPDLVVLKACHQGRVVGMHSWMITGNVAFSHLSAVSAEGYDLMASYGLYLYAMEYFRGRCALLNLGGSAGLKNNGDGLAKFKKGWATHTSTAYLCKKIFDPHKYQEAVRLNQAEGSSYFPAYREKMR